MLIYQLITRKGFTYKEFFTSTRPRGQWPATGHCYEDHFVHVNQFHSLIGYIAACTSNVCFMDSIAALWRWRYPWLIPLNEPTTVVYQILHISFTTLANNHVVVTGKKNPSNGKESQKEDVGIEVHCHISHFEWMCMLVWSTELVRGGFYRELEGKIRMKLTIWGGESFKEHNKKS